MPFEFKELELAGVVLVTPKVFNDSRGHFLETYKESEFEFKSSIKGPFLQDNQSFSTQNVLRGIHFQKNPKPQGKIVRCLVGSILDVAVDLRPESPTFKQYVKVELTADNKQMLFIPIGFGHAFLTLSKEAVISYKCTNEYDPKLDGGIIWNDPEIGIDWGIENPLISDKDAKLPKLKDL